MSSTLRLRLADGTEIDATAEGAISPALRDLLAVGYVGNQMRIAADESADVSGHALATTVLVRLYDEDDVEGHALTLHLPNAQAAQDLQRKLLAAGIAGLIVVGAATTAVVAPNLTSPAGPAAAPAPITQTIPVAPDAASHYQASTEYGQSQVPGVAQGVYPGTTTPGYGQSVVPPVAQGVYPTTGAVAQPDVAPGLKADIATGDAAAPTIPQAVVPPGVAAEIAGGQMAASDYGQSVVPPVAQGIYPAGGAKSTVPVPGEQSIAPSNVAAPGYGQSVVPPVAEGVYPAASSESHAGYPAAPSQALTDYEVHGGYPAAPSQAVDSESHAGYPAAPSQALTDYEVHGGYQAAPSQAVDSESHAGWVQAPSQAVDESHAGWVQAPSQAADAPGWADPSRPHTAPAAESQAGWADPSRPHTAPAGDTVAPGLKADIATGDVDEGTDPATPSDRIGGR